MPTYMVSAATDRLSREHKARVAQEITRIHKEVTGAQAFFAQVIFVEIAPGDHFIGGVPTHSDQVFVHGHIRAGRSAEQKTNLLIQLVDAVSLAAGVERNGVWAYIAELPPIQMVEYGHVLPEAGAETEWMNNLPRRDRDRLEAIGA